MQIHILKIRQYSFYFEMISCILRKANINNDIYVLFNCDGIKYAI